MHPKNFKIILYLPLVLFFMANLFLYFPPSAKAEVNDTMPRLQIPIPQLNFTPIKKIIEECKEENGQKICNFPWIGEYIAGIYKYAIGIVGILAAVVLMVGGVMWIMAGGSATMIGEAKAWIGASLTGLVIALTSYLILYQINPALTVFPPLGITQVKPLPLTKTDLCAWQLYECKGNQTKGEADSCGEKPLGDNYEYCCCAARRGEASAACSSEYRKGNIVEFNFIKQAISPPSACERANHEYNFVYDTPANILRALAATESSCNPQAESPDRACGLMQLLPATAKIYDPEDADEIDCEWLKNNPQKSIAIASKFIRDSKHANVHDNQPSRIFAGYNSGYSDKPYNCRIPDDSRTCKLAALAASNDCRGNFAFECCIDPGELTQTQDHVFRSMRYLNWINNNKGF
ncbi:MAG: transglycosylase SLT domain-containing protein [Parcubacteria group bacterium]|nr:transglycosylase SLT domain-containing protein [Parcubacteria group bacterium]